MRQKYLLRNRPSSPSPGCSSFLPYHYHLPPAPHSPKNLSKNPTRNQMLLSSQSHLISSTLKLRAQPLPPRTSTPSIKPLLALGPQCLRPSSIFLDARAQKWWSVERRGLAQVCFSSVEEQGPEKEEWKRGGGEWTSSVLLFGLWAGLMYYVFRLTPDQTPVRDEYFLQKLMYLKGEDGFRMNQVLVAVWYIMAMWPLVYSMLLTPSGRSSKSNIPVWPFLVLSCIGGAYALIPYFVLWSPPPPAVEEDELGRWPLNFFESKITAGVTLAAGMGLLIYGGLANAADWTEFYQYFRESKLVHITCIDLSLLTAFAPFWVYNDMAARKWIDKGFWLLPLALIPFVGPALYLLLRPPLSALPTISSGTTETE